MSGGLGEDEGSGVGFTTARGRDWPSVRQFNVFVANRLGGLANVIRRFETTDIRIVSLTIVDSADCAIIRLVLSDPERAKEIFEQANLPFTESDLLVVTDSTRDRFGSGGWQRARCHGLGVQGGTLAPGGCRSLGAGKPPWLTPIRLSG